MRGYTWVFRTSLLESGRQLFGRGIPALILALGLLLYVRLRLTFKKRGGRQIQPTLPAPETIRPPLAPTSLIERLLIAARTYRIPGYLQQMRGPMLATSYAEHTTATIIEWLDREPRAAPGRIARALARFTSHLKHAGIVGWADTGRQAMLEGWIDDHEPVLSSDGMMTIDLQIIRLLVDQEDVTPLLSQPCYIRVEVFGAVQRELSRRPRQGDCLRITGPLRIDNDGFDFYEIHPRSGQDIQIIDCPGLALHPSVPRRKSFRAQLRSRLWPFD
ncbi:MAG: hypothetical protein KatS3mg057_0599 [Herpetosiphonaceae bacterium]|nr:MAG: hypothetical protein KatS3mg057_0599 [Herpetosiphonaceae bacterium]